MVDQRKYKKSDPWRGTQERLNRRQPKLQTTCPQSQTRAPMGSAVLFFLDFRGFCMVCFAVYCCYHIKLPFILRNPCRTLQNLAKSTLSHLPPPHPPLSKKHNPGQAVAAVKVSVSKTPNERENSAQPSPYHPYLYVNTHQYTLACSLTGAGHINRLSRSLRRLISDQSS